MFGYCSNHKINKITLSLFNRVMFPFIYKFCGINYINNCLIPYLRDPYLKRTLIRLNASIGNDSYFASNIITENVTNDFSNLRIGSKCRIGTMTFFDLVEPIIIEDEVAVSAEVMFLTHADPGERPLRQYFSREVGGIRVGKGSWIGARAIVLPGVTIGECSVIGAGGVVTKDIPPFSVAVGVPAKVIRMLKYSNFPISVEDNQAFNKG